MTEAQDMEELISRGLRERVNYFKEQANSLTLEGVRRVLEKDLGLKKFALDVHKRFVKKCLEESFASLDDECSAKKTEENGEQAVTDEEKAEASVEQQSGEKKNNSVDDEKGSQASHKEVKAEPESEKTDTEDVISEDTVKKAVNDRAAYFREHAATITMVGVRRLLEDDLKLEKHALDVHKALIKMAVNEVINSADAEDEEVDKGEGSSDAESPEQSSSEEAEIEDQKKPKSPKTAEKKRATNSEGQKKRKRVEENLNVRKKKPEVSEQKSDDSDEDGSQTSGEDRAKKKKEASSQVYGKHVEHLKSVIKACGMNVPPSVYKRAKQAPENKREDILAKELEEILKKEGLSRNPSEKEIKAVKKKKERAKELEGIDTSNIVSSSRRRSSSFFTKPSPPPPPPPPPLKAKIPVEGGEEAEGDEEEDDEEEESEEENSDNGESSEEFNEDADDDSD
ncbi:hypothetical protein H6P81_011047 [Aristolochia fimbriata]|uniref:Histone chaperone domain-containing protein n=1 Tax=Aristolochia fimbriata TaxID=158543 RepID=A0AAV7ETW5_ARIFI|nr:hypothetical protein H6P81_011047 [Aristolochia fimbriata]